MTASYDRFAPHFDDWQRAFGGAYDALILPRLRAALARHPQPVARIVDLGIGTGDLVIALARDGYDVVGVDRSAPMLDVAAAKIAAAALPRAPALRRQDLRELALAPPADAAICVYTVMNQLTGDGDLARAAAAVRGALVPGGLFLFELNLPEAYDRHWTGIETTTLPGAVVRREHRRDGPLIEAAVTIERADGVTLHDHIAQRCWDDAAVGTALAAAGLVVSDVERFNPFEPAGPAVKALWSARRRG